MRSAEAEARGTITSMMVAMSTAMRMIWMYMRKAVRSPMGMPWLATWMLPNQTMREIFTDYFNTLARITVSTGYIDYFRQFIVDLDLDKLFGGYWQVYVGQLPAPLFDKMNENFFRTTFFELCARYLSHDFTFAVEVNVPSGRSDWEMLGKPDSQFANTKFLLEFKYIPIKEEHKSRLLQLTAPLPEDVAQVTGYAEDIHREFPKFTIHRYIVYIVGRKGFRMFHLPPN